MKLIIDIPDNQYNQICELRLHNRTIYDEAIRNGIPLDKIRAEIIQERDGDMGGSQEIIDGFVYGCNTALEIIDKYREEQE